MTPAAIERAAALGCQALVTHHPAYLEAPGRVSPAVATSSLSGACVWQAARLGVALIAMHTNLDRSDEALDLTASMLGLERAGRLQEPDGFGSVLVCERMALGELARRAARAFGCVPTVWGDEGRVLSRAAFCSGSIGDLWRLCVDRGIDCIIGGEGGYHRVEEAFEGGVAAILLGHDASELPYAGLLARAVRRIAPDTTVHVIDEPLRWHALGSARE